MKLKGDKGKRKKRKTKNKTDKTKTKSLEFLILMTEHAVQVVMDDLSFLSCYVWYGEITGQVTDSLSGFIE